MSPNLQSFEKNTDAMIDKIMPKPRRTGSKCQKGCFGSNKKAKRVAAINHYQKQARDAYARKVAEYESEKVTQSMMDAAKAFQNLPAPTPVVEDWGHPPDDYVEPVEVWEPEFPGLDKAWAEKNGVTQEALDLADQVIAEVESGTIDLPPTPDHLKPAAIAEMVASGGRLSGNKTNHQ